MPTIQIEQIHPALTWRIRHEAMYPDQPFNFVKLDNDFDGLHFGLYANDQLTAVVSLFEEADVWQFRKFATVPESQGNGFGTLLLQHIIGYARARGAKKLWCNARTNAKPFYGKFGFQPTEKTFTKSGYDFVIMALEL